MISMTMTMTPVTMTCHRYARRSKLYRSEQGDFQMGKSKQKRNDRPTNMISNEIVQQANTYFAHLSPSFLTWFQNVFLRYDSQMKTKTNYVFGVGFVHHQIY